MTSKVLAKNARGTLLRNQSIPRLVAPFGNHPHLVDFYVPNGNTQIALVFLHGGSGTKESVANQILLCRGNPPAASNVWWRLLEAFQCVVAIPQGQHCTVANTGPFNPNGVTTETPANPQGVSAWSNWFLWSGADDVRFLKDLATYITANFTIGLAKVLAGHSAGGMQVQRMAYETGATYYQRMITISGPANNYYAKPGYVSSFPNVPMLSVIGAKDENVGVWNGVAGAGSHFYDSEWHQQPKNRTVCNVEYPNLDHFVGEFTGYKQRVLDLASAVVQPSDGVTSSAQRLGTVTAWRNNTARQELWWLSEGAHGLKEIQQANGAILVDGLQWALNI